MDADVNLIEAARSRMELLHDWERTGYAQEIGPGVYDIHSPRVPSTDEMADLLEEAAKVLQPEQIWVNPDCGLKTRGVARDGGGAAQHGRCRPSGARERHRVCVGRVKC